MSTPRPLRAPARLRFTCSIFGPGADLVQIDVNGDGQSDMEINLINLTGPLNNFNFLLG